MNNEIYNERKAKFNYDLRILEDKGFRDDECSVVKLICTDAMAAQNWIRVRKCTEFLIKFDNKTNEELEIDEVVDGAILTNEENTANDTLYLTGSDTVEDEPIIVNRLQ